MVASENVPVVALASSPVARAPLPRWTVQVVAVLVLLVDVVVTVAMWRWVDVALADLDKRAAAHLDVLKLTASIAVGGGGLFALYLAARRQRTQELELAQREKVQAHAEQVAEHSHTDAVERRITELYLKAVEQLGSDKAAVRLGGLYALERLAQDNADQRSTVIRVYCAYLRMPFEVPAEPPPPHDADYKTALAEHRERVQEREVRVAAQRILRDHLRPGDAPQTVATFWPDLDLDLTGAHLIDFDFRHCTARTALFGSARFSGFAGFGSARFSGSVDFKSATFTGFTGFKSATFSSSVDFASATFTDFVDFKSATFSGSAGFRLATFSDFTYFKSATFTGSTDFESATFTGSTDFRSATFSDFTYFKSATFTGSTDFRAATFAGPTNFGSATFTGPADFQSTTFDRGVPLEVRRILPATE